MLSKHVIAGEFCHHDELDWQPLYDLVGVNLADWFISSRRGRQGFRVHIALPVS